MNSSLPRRTGLACRLTRWRSSVVGAKPATGHGACCPDCRRFFADGAELESSLRREARSRAPAPAGLEQGILAAVHQAQSAERPSGARSGEKWSGIGVGLAAALVLGGLIWQWRGAGSTPVGNSVADTRVILDATDALTERLVTSVLPIFVATVEDNALRQEADAVYADARTALQFLALNFLPSAIANSTSMEARAPSAARPAGEAAAASSAL